VHIGAGCSAQANEQRERHHDEQPDKGEGEPRHTGSNEEWDAKQFTASGGEEGSDSESEESIFRFRSHMFLEAGVQ
jgi:hypothetical protein